MTENLLVFDIDGTLAPHDAEPHPDLYPTLKTCHERGIPMIVATARRRSSGHMRLGPMADFLENGVFNNGACTWEAGSIVAYQEIKRDLLHDCYQRMTAFPQAHCTSIAMADERIAFSRELTAVELDQWGVAEGHICALEIALSNEPIRLCTWSEEHKLHALYDELTSAYSEEEMHWRLIDGGHCIFGTAPGLDKSAGVRVWCERKNIDPKNVIAFGDDVSDTEMLRWAGIGVAVANAHPEVKAASDQQCESCIDGGVAKWIQRHVLS